MKPNLDQINLNKIKVGFRSIFVADWHPFIGWVYGFALLWHSILFDLLTWIMVISFPQVTELPILSGTETLLPVLLWLLALEWKMVKPSLAQIKLNKTKVHLHSIFVSNWRPLIGWVCAFAFLWDSILSDLRIWIKVIFFPQVTELPALSGNETLLTVLLWMLSLEAAMMMKPSLAQIELNKMGIGHRSIFGVDWLPFVGWVCALAFLWHFILFGIVTWIKVIFFPQVTELPALSGNETLVIVLFSVLGFGTVRSAEKLIGKAK